MDHHCSGVFIACLFYWPHQTDLFVANSEWCCCHLESLGSFPRETMGNGCTDLSLTWCNRWVWFLQAILCSYWDIYSGTAFAYLGSISSPSGMDAKLHGGGVSYIFTASLALSLATNAVTTLLIAYRFLYVKSYEYLSYVFLFDTSWIIGPTKNSLLKTLDQVNGSLPCRRSWVFS